MFIKTLTTTAVLALYAATVAARGFGCGAPEPDHYQLEDAKSFFREFRANGVEAQALAAFTVTTYVHVVSTAASKHITQTQVNNQIAALNKAYAPQNISFKLAATDFTVNSSWGKDGNENAMKKALRKGAYKDLNLYFTESLGDGLLGYCYFPVSKPTAADKQIDGCTILAQSVPGGTAAPFNLGGTAIHEVGHWMNLFHTFQGGCSSTGDSVDDTPAQASASSGCPTGRDSCPNLAGADPIHNYMDYSDDSCYEEFTSGQDARMHNAWTNLRLTATV